MLVPINALEAKFGAIFYVPGNHECSSRAVVQTVPWMRYVRIVFRLWVSKKDGLSSVHKFLAILEAEACCTLGAILTSHPVSQC